MTRILIVDDSATMRRMVRVSLHALAGASFDEAGTGLEAIERLALAPADLVVLDLNVPDMHGLDVLHFVRRHQAYQSIPVLVLTTLDDDASRSEALAAGASDYITKPFDPRVLAARAGHLLGLAG